MWNWNKKALREITGFCQTKKIDGTSVAELICISFLLIDRLILFHILIYRTRHSGTIKAGYGKSSFKQSFKQSVNPQTQWAIYTTSQSLRNDLIVLIPQVGKLAHAPHQQCSRVPSCWSVEFFCSVQKIARASSVIIVSQIELIAMTAE